MLPTRSLRASCLAALATASAMLLVAGCSDDGLPKRYRVAGAVKYKGTPIEKGEINFAPESADGRAASGPIINGGYTLSTAGDNDGALPGRYKVTVTSRNVDLSAAEAKVKSIPGGKVALPQDYVAKAYKDAKNLIPTKYSLPNTSGLTGEVKAQSNTINFDLTD